jgi:N-acetylmuramoyl-L-alanine amidase
MTPIQKFAVMLVAPMALTTLGVTAFAQTASNPQNPVVLDRQDIGAIQRRLQDEGYYAGPINGFLDPLTRQALADFQRDMHIPIVGTINSDTLAALDFDVGAQQAQLPERRTRSLGDVENLRTDEHMSAPNVRGDRYPENGAGIPEARSRLQPAPPGP